jgi:RNA polymerase sigma-70 factor (ECF subfamily)
VPDPFDNREVPSARRAFVTTQWSLILTAQGAGPDAATALDDLCRDYWPPLFVYARRDGLSTEDAQDAVQGFIAHLLARNDLRHVAPEKGRFRSFLLAAFKHFLVSRCRSENAGKRGGGSVVVSLDVDELVGVDEAELADSASPDKAFDRSWARHLMARAMERLGRDHGTPQQARLFAALRPSLMDGGRLVQAAELAAGLGVTPGALAVAATRLRRRYRSLIEDEVRRTLADPANLAEEMRALWSAWN